VAPRCHATKRIIQADFLKKNFIREGDQSRERSFLPSGKLRIGRGGGDAAIGQKLKSPIKTEKNIHL